MIFTSILTLVTTSIILDVIESDPHILNNSFILLMNVEFEHLESKSTYLNHIIHSFWLF